MIKSADELIRQAQLNIECVDAATARRIRDDNPDALIIDVREANSVAESKLEESIHISRGVLEYGIHKVCPEANTVIITHCAGGGRASLAAHTLKQMGYHQVYAICAPYEEIRAAFE